MLDAITWALKRRPFSGWWQKTELRVSKHKNLCPIVGFEAGESPVGKRVGSF